jgi:hypothetical protein
MSGAVRVASARMRGGSLTLNRLELDRSEAESCFGVGLLCLLACFGVLHCVVWLSARYIPLSVCRTCCCLDSFQLIRLYLLVCAALSAYEAGSVPISIPGYLLG